MINFRAIAKQILTQPAVAPRFFRLLGLDLPSQTRTGTLTEAAKRLAVTREHLSRVLHGHRQSRSLSRRYAELKQAA